ncbi:MAG: hypothetical protein U0746_15025 [Gemmataceae bacterium]
MNRRQFLVASTAATAVPALAQRPAGDVEATFADLAHTVAAKASGMIAGKLSSDGRVAVFAPGDATGKLTVQMQEGARILQGELIYHLINLAKGRYFVLDKAALAQAFAKASVKPDALDRSNPRKTASALAKLELDAVVFGTIDAKAADQFQATADTTLQIVFKDGSAQQLAGRTPASAVGSASSDAVPRLRAQIWLAPPGQTPRRVPIVTDRRAASPQHRVFYAVLPDGLALGTDTARYIIRLLNSGQDRTGDFTHPDAIREKQRLLTVALAIDGVNSIYQDRGDGTVGPVMLHPRNAARWIVTGPGLVMVKSGPKPTDFRFDPAPNSGPGQSVVDVPGFQRDAQTALAFTFAKPQESIAEAVGVTGEVGVISISARSQKLPGDKQTRFAMRGDMPGTKAGAPVLNPVVRFQVDTYPDEFAQYRIIYRPSSQVPIPPADRVDAWSVATL